MFSILTSCMKRNSLTSFAESARYISHSSRKTEIESVCGKILSLGLPNCTHFQVHPVWLRHHCQCEKCYNQKTHQRMSIPSNLPTTSTVTNAVVDGNKINVIWNDSHVSKFEVEWLQHYAPKARMEAGTKQNSHVEIKFPVSNLNEILFRNEMQPPSDPLDTAISYNKFMEIGDDGVVHLLTSILKFGYGIVNECPPDFETTKKVISKVSHPQNTLFGDFSEWTSDLTHADTAYTADVVHMHTDTSYFTEPIGLQIFHCLAHEGSGGLNSILDGFHVAKLLAEDCRESYELLSSVSIPCQYLDPGKHHFQSYDVTFGHDFISGQIRRIRYNPHDMATLHTIPFEFVSKFYESLINLSDLLEQTPQHIKLTPGVVIFLDNWRVLHGRSAFTGFRHLCGSYISRSDWRSRARTLGLLKVY